MKMSKKELRHQLEASVHNSNVLAKEVERADIVAKQLRDTNVELCRRAEKAKALVRKLVDCGNAMAEGRVYSIGYDGVVYSWHKLADEWKAQNK